jgi:hypothetical protein
MMDEQYEYVMRASHGFMQVRLTLSDETALVEFDSSVRYVIHCSHKRLSDFHGELKMTSLEHYPSQRNKHDALLFSDTPESVNLARLLDFRGVYDPGDDKEVLTQLGRLEFEYLRLPQPLIALNDPYEFGGLFEWPERFSLILLIHYAGFWDALTQPSELPELVTYLGYLDKLHMAAAGK